MSNIKSPKNKDGWDKADVISKFLIPVFIVIATAWINSSIKDRESEQRTFEKVREAKQKTFEVAIDILKTPASEENKEIRKWAIDIFQRETGVAASKLTDGAISELKRGTQLPSTSQLRLPNPGQLLRVSIIRLEKTNAEKSERIKSDLMDAGYTNIEMGERPQNLFPNRAEVRFYYPADSQNAKSLRDYIYNTLGIPIEVNDRSQDKDVSNHRPGDLHIYVNR